MKTYTRYVLLLVHRHTEGHSSVFFGLRSERKERAGRLFLSFGLLPVPLWIMESREGRANEKIDNERKKLR